MQRLVRPSHRKGLFDNDLIRHRMELEFGIRSEGNDLAMLRVGLVHVNMLCGTN